MNKHEILKKNMLTIGETSDFNKWAWMGSYEAGKKPLRALEDNLSLKTGCLGRCCCSHTGLKFHNIFKSSINTQCYNINTQK